MKRIGKTMNAYFIIFLFIPFLSGCWDSIDIEKRGTVLAIAIDKVETDENEDYITHFPKSQIGSADEMIRITAQVSVPGRIPLGPESTGGGEDQEPVWVLDAIGHTLEDALFNLQQELADELFLGHLRIIVISEEVAKEGIERFNDYLRRQPEVRRTTWLVVSKERAADYMEIAPKLERVPALYLKSMVQKGVDLGKFPYDDIGIFWRALSSKGQDGYLPYLQIKDKENVQIKGLAYFKENKMLGTIDPIEIGLFMAVIGESEGGYGSFIKIPDAEEMVLVEAVKRKSRIKTTIKDGKPEIHIKVRYESEIGEKTNEKTPINDSKIIRKIEQVASEETKNSLNRLIKKMQEEGTDIFGFGEYVRAKQPRFWNETVKTKETWNSIFKDINVHVEMDTHIRRVGMKDQ
ncbi:Ger(x)C family spore germination protein [Bacillus niameyensis]|uniref:Ger(x)C family spore germination protein n=1 Tax=Bacillus niameyensis TaxID=1522308 RepID=UPI0007847370|nr:Ger(x)C family spore germination protein [Bacillus niameyensis]